MTQQPAETEIHLWETSLATKALDGPAPLSDDEWRRADRFHFAHDRTAFIAARSWLRTVLSGYVGAAPGALRFAYGEAGKPSLAGDGALSALSFNLSHSGGRAALAVAWRREIGIDIEAVRPVEPNIVGRFFAEGEIRAWSALPPEDRIDAFFACWTRKEAFLKATGLGLGTVRLDAFEVSLAPGAPAAVLSVAGDPAEARLWQMVDIATGPDFAGAIASRSRGWSVRRMSDHRGLRT